MKLGIADFRVIKSALEIVPSYVLDRQHRTRYDAVRLARVIGAEIDKSENAIAKPNMAIRLTIADLRLIKVALEVVPSYVLEKQHKTEYDAVLLESMIGIEIDKSEKRKEIADKQGRMIRKAREEALRQSNFAVDKSKLNSRFEKNTITKPKRKATKAKLEFPNLNLKGKKKGAGNDKKAINEKNREDRGRAPVL